LASRTDVSLIVNLAGLVGCTGAAAGEGRCCRRAWEVHLNGLVVVHGLSNDLCSALAVLGADLGTVMMTGTRGAAVDRVAGSVGGKAV
jgi:hypothetical protein